MVEKAELKGQIEYLEENIKLKKKLGKDVKLETKLLESWREYPRKPHQKAPNAKRRALKVK